MKLGDSLKKALVLGLSLFASSGASAVEEISKRVLNTQCRCDVWEVCCAPDSGLTQACLDAGLHAERYTIENGYDMRKRSTGVTLATKAKAKAKSRATEFAMNSDEENAQATEEQSWGQADGE